MQISFIPIPLFARPRHITQADLRWQESRHIKLLLLLLFTSRG